MDVYYNVSLISSINFLAIQFNSLFLLLLLHHHHLLLKIMAVSIRLCIGAEISDGSSSAMTFTWYTICVKSFWTTLEHAFWTFQRMSPQNFVNGLEETLNRNLAKIFRALFILEHAVGKIKSFWALLWIGYSLCMSLHHYTLKSKLKEIQIRTNRN